MREHDLLAVSRAGSLRDLRSHDGTIIPGPVDSIWGTDLTTTLSGKVVAVKGKWIETASPLHGGRFAICLAWRRFVILIQSQTKSDRCIARC